MAKVKSRQSIDAIHLGTEPSFNTDYEGSVRKMVLVDAFNYYNYKFKAADHKKVCVTYAKVAYSGADLAAIVACSPAMFSNTVASLIRISKRGWKLNDDENRFITSAFNGIIAFGMSQAKESPEESKKATPKPNPQARLVNKINQTIIKDLDSLDEEWMEGYENVSINIFELVQAHGISGAKSSPHIVAWASERIDEYNRALSNASADADFKEAYRHLTPAKIRKRIKVLDSIISDSEQLVLAAKATRKTRKPKPKAAEKQVEKVQYEKSNTNYRVVSVNPVDIVGRHRLYTFNTKYRIFTMYVTDRIDGFEIKGTTILHATETRATKLRDPEKFLKIAQKKTPNQIKKEWNKLTTKDSVAKQRFGKDTILLRVL